MPRRSAQCCCRFRSRTCRGRCRGGRVGTSVADPNPVLQPPVPVGHHALRVLATCNWLPLTGLRNHAGFQPSAENGDMLGAWHSRPLREVDHHEDDHFGGSLVGFRVFLRLDLSACYPDVPTCGRQDTSAFWAATGQVTEQHSHAPDATNRANGRLQSRGFSLLPFCVSAPERLACTQRRFSLSFTREPGTGKRPNPGGASFAVP